MWRLVRLDRVDPQRTLLGDRQPAVHRGPGHDHVVALPGGELAENRLHERRAGLDEHALVTDGVAVQRTWSPGDRVADADVRVAQHEPAAGDDIDSRTGRRLVLG